MATQNIRRYTAHDVYSNLHEMLKYRGATKIPTQLSMAEFTKKINNDGYVTIDAITGRGKMFIIQINEGSDYASSAPAFKKLFALLPVWKDEINVMFVMAVKPNTRLLKVIHAHVAEKPNMYIEAYHYSKFCIVIPNATAKHEIVDPGPICDTYRIMANNFQKIYDTDPPVVWIGGRAGDLCKIHRLSNTAGEAIGYRYVIPDPNMNV
jgi:DNA-directed RNA polymerase subunit H (RpoH/RPB5)